MYTQCEKCQAIFEVNTRELTAAKGKLRCGECGTTFDGTKTLSTSMPKAYENLFVDESSANDSFSHTADNSMIEETPEVAPKEKISSWLPFSALILSLLLATQILYNYRHLFMDVIIRAPEKIEMLSHNVFAHPNEAGALLISALIENNSKHEQPYPTLELRLEDSQSNLVAFRRFYPKEYLKDYSENLLIPSKKPITLKLKIKDPGPKATHFKFNFL